MEKELLILKRKKAKELHKKGWSNRKIAKLLLNIKAVSLKPKGGFVYASGRNGPIYCDNRLILSYSKQRDEIIQAFLNVIKERKLNFDEVSCSSR